MVTPFRFDGLTDLCGVLCARRTGSRIDRRPQCWADHSAICKTVVFRPQSHISSAPRSTRILGLNFCTPFPNEVC